MITRQRLLSGITLVVLFATLGSACSKKESPLPTPPPPRQSAASQGEVKVETTNTETKTADTPPVTAPEQPSSQGGPQIAENGTATEILPGVTMILPDDSKVVTHLSDLSMFQGNLGGATVVVNAIQSVQLEDPNSEDAKAVIKAQADAFAFMDDKTSEESTRKIGGTDCPTSVFSGKQQGTPTRVEVLVNKGYMVLVSAQGSDENALKAATDLLDSLTFGA